MPEPRRVPSPQGPPADMEITAEAVAWSTAIVVLASLAGAALV